MIGPSLLGDINEVPTQKPREDGTARNLKSLDRIHLSLNNPSRQRAVRDNHLEPGGRGAGSLKSETKICFFFFPPRVSCGCFFFVC